MTTGNNQGGAGLDRYLPAVPADWAPPVRTVGDALDQLGARGGGAGFAASYVWRPGGVASPGVYVTWASLVAAFVAVDNAARKIVSVDDSLANAHVTTGAWGIENVEFRSGGNCLANDAVATINIDEGATFTGTHHLSFDGINVNDAHTATALVTTSANNDLAVDLRACAFLQTGGSATGTFVLGAGSELSLRMYAASVFGDGTHTVVTGSATSGALVFAYCESLVEPNAFNLTAGGAVVIEADGSCVVSATQTPAPTILILDPTTSLLFQPGGTAGGNVYVTWPTLMAARAQIPGEATILIDDSIAAAHATTSGSSTWNVDGTTFLGRKWFGSTLIVDDGCKWASFSAIRVQQGLTISSVSTSPVVTTAGSLTIYCEELSTIQAGAAAVFIAQSAGNTLLYAVRSTFGDGTHSMISVAAGATCFAYLSANGALAASAAKGAGTVEQLYTDDVTLNAQPGITTNTLIPVTPINFVQAQANTGTGTGTTTVVTGNIQQAKSGKVQIAGAASGVLSGGGTITVTLLRDATTILTLPPFTVLATQSFAIPVNFIDTLPDAAVHTYTIKAVASAGNITPGAGGNTIVANEL